MADVFVSYSREDKARAAEVVRLLEDHGWDVFWDQETRTGTLWPKVLEDELGAARCLVALWTKTSVASRWVRIEAYEALQSDKLVPVLLDKVRPPLEFRQTQTFDLSGWEGDRDDPRLSHLVTDLTALAKAPRARGTKPRSLQLVAQTTIRHEVPAETPANDGAPDAQPSTVAEDVTDAHPAATQMGGAGSKTAFSRGLMVGLGVVAVAAVAWLINSNEPPAKPTGPEPPISDAKPTPPAPQPTPIDPLPEKKIVVADPVPPKPVKPAAKVTQRPARCAAIEEKFQQTGQLTAAEQSILRSKECQ